MEVCWGRKKPTYLTADGLEADAKSGYLIVVCGEAASTRDRF